jgi:hypothetical protein
MRRVISPPPHHHQIDLLFLFFLAFFFAAIGASFFISPAGTYREVGVFLRRKRCRATLQILSIKEL